MGEGRADYSIAVSEEEASASDESRGAEAVDVDGKDAGLPECRICYMADNSERMVAACGCQGSLKYTHLGCLQLWTEEQGSSKCEICQQEYRPELLPQLKDAVERGQQRLQDSGGVHTVEVARYNAELQAQYRRSDRPSRNSMQGQWELLAVESACAGSSALPGCPMEAPPAQDLLLGKAPEPAGRSKRSWACRLFQKQQAPELENESLDFDQVQNRVSQARSNRQTKRRHFYGYTGHTLAKFAITASTGILTGLVAAGLAGATEVLILHRKAWLVSIIRMGPASAWPPTGLLHAYGFHIAYSITLLLLAGCLVQFWAPAAAGGGVSQVMAYLNGSDVPDLLRLRTLVAKLIGTICGVASNMAVGPEAPMVHVGAGIASVISYMQGGALLRCCWWVKERRRTGGLTLTETQGRLHSDADHREFISAGAAAGLAAAFGAPIGGVLFSMEEACSYWSARVLWRCLLAAAMATFTLAQLHPRSQAGLLSFDGRRDTMDNVDWLWQGPFFVVVSVLAGLLGALFNLLRKWLWRVRASRKAHLLRLLEVVGLAIITITTIFLLSWHFGRCVKIPDEWAEVEYGFAFNCPEGQYNDLATQLMSIPAETIRHIFAMNVDSPSSNPVLAHSHPWNTGCSATVPCRFTMRSLGITSVAYLVLMAAASGLAVPGGLFMPSIMVGSSFGAMCGLLLLRWLPVGWNVQPGVYAVVAGTAVLAGVFRSSISLVVIVVEGTRGIDFTFGVIIAVVCANWVAHHIHRDGVYESELERDGTVFFLRSEPPHALRYTTARRIMATNVVTFNEVESLTRVVEVLRGCAHNGFPVYSMDRETEERSGRLEGLILRSQLLVLLQNGIFCDAQGIPATHSSVAAEKLEAQLDAQMRSFYRVNHMHRRSRASQPDVVEHLVALQAGRLHQPAGSTRQAASDCVDSAERGQAGVAAPSIEGLYLDLRPYMHRAPLTVRPECAGPRLHEIFYSLGLRHLCVVDGRNTVVGMITRKDLDRAAGHGWWRMNSLPASIDRSQLQPRRGMSGVLQQLVASPSAFVRGFLAAPSNHSPRA
ncbi:hypothetical protein WJX72_004634 [[Myrmecia] bisecta]|uniref:Chloride channel protein n=1 Tax=[Myrmecia] bisecta TaxID=41462 RepID=A0AAW1PH49_9CHLO